MKTALSEDKGFICFEESLKYTLRSSSNHIKLASIYLPMHKIFVFFVILDVLRNPNNFCGFRGFCETKMINDKLKMNNSLLYIEKFLYVCRRLVKMNN